MKQLDSAINALQTEGNELLHIRPGRVVPLARLLRTRDDLRDRQRQPADTPATASAFHQLVPEHLSIDQLVRGVLGLLTLACVALVLVACSPTEERDSAAAPPPSTTSQQNIESEHSDLEPRTQATDAAASILAKAQIEEPSITVHVIGAIDAVGGYPTRLDSRLKTEKSLVRKIDDQITEGLTVEQAAGKIRDSVRYTGVVPDPGYWERGTELIEHLEGVGYRLEKNPRGWSDNGYRGRNMTFISPTGQEFEVQVHTTASLKASESTHALYEEFRRPNISPDRKVEIAAEMDAIFASVPVPPGTPVIG